MARRRKQSSKCTSAVAGLNTDASDESDLGKLFPIKPLEEESGRISDDDSCLPLIGKSSSSESATDDVATELDDVIADLEPISGDHQLSTDLGFPESLLPLDSAHDLHQVNPNLSISRSDMDPSGSSIAKPQDYSLNVIANSAILDERACPRENQCSSHNPTEHENLNDNAMVQNTKTHDPGAVQTCLNPNPPPEPPTDVGTELPGDSLAQAPILLTETFPPGCSSAEQPIPKPTCDMPQHEHSIRQPKGLQQQGNAIDGFQLVQNRRQKKKSGLRSNPEHQQYKPRATPSS
ncbi:hypothetical protein Dimus_032223 [Dionaea muscipula]